MKEINTIEKNGAETTKVQHQEEALCFIQSSPVGLRSYVLYREISGQS